MHMRNCKRCPVPQQGVVSRDLVEDVALFSSLLPVDGIAKLFESGECTLCKGAKGSSTGFAIYDMAHAEPKRIQRKSIFTTQGRSGFMVPLQFACCKKCRGRLLWLEYLPMLGAILGVAIGVLLTISEAGTVELKAAFPALPLVLVAGGLLVGFLLGHAIRLILRHRWKKQMYLDIHAHPTVAAMESMGWFSVFGGNTGRLVLTKRRINQGLGTATDAELSAEFWPEPDFDACNNNE